MTRDWEAATRSGDIAVVGELIRAGVNVNSLDRYNQTALMHAAHRGDLDMVKLFVANGAKLEVRAKLRLSALDLARIGHHDEVVEFLLAAGAQPEQPRDGPG